MPAEGYDRSDLGQGRELTRRDDVKANGNSEVVYRFWPKRLLVEAAHHGDKDQNRVMARAWGEGYSWRARHVLTVMQGGGGDAL